MTRSRHCRAQPASFIRVCEPGRSAGAGRCSNRGHRATVFPRRSSHPELTGGLRDEYDDAATIATSAGSRKSIEWAEAPPIHNRGHTSKCRLSPVSLLASPSCLNTSLRMRQLHKSGPRGHRCGVAGWDCICRTCRIPSRSRSLFKPIATCGLRDFGSSRQLIVGPDAATCAVIAVRRRSPRSR